MPTAAAIARRNIATKTAPAIISKTFSAISIINKIQIKHQNTWKTRHECSKLQKNNNTRKNICFSYCKNNFARVFTTCLKFSTICLIFQFL